MIYKTKKQVMLASPKMSRGGYTLIELMVSVGLFAIIMLLSSGSYLMMIGLNRQVQGIATGINNLSFALETMTRDIRTGSKYCAVGPPCSTSSFSFQSNQDNQTTTYSLVSGAITKDNTPLTDSSSVTITSLTFDTVGMTPGDSIQSQVTITVSGTVSGKISQSFTIKTSATMRSLDI